MQRDTSTAKRYTYIDKWGDPITLFFVKSSYRIGGGLYIECHCETFDEDLEEVCEEPYAPITVNLGPTTAPDVAFVDMNNSGRIIWWMIAQGLATPAGSSLVSGFCEYFSVRFSEDFLDGVLDLSGQSGD